MKVEPVSKDAVAKIRLAHEEAERQGTNTNAHLHRRDLLVAIEGMQQIIDSLAWTETDLQMKLSEARREAEYMLNDIQREEYRLLAKYDEPYKLPWM